MTLLVYALVCVATVVALAATVVRAVGYARMPLHLRWELYPVPHEASERAAHGDVRRDALPEGPPGVQPPAVVAVLPLPLRSLPPDRHRRARAGRGGGDPDLAGYDSINYGLWYDDARLALDPARNDLPVTLHDPGNMVRLMGVVELQRDIVRASCLGIRESDGWEP